MICRPKLLCIDKTQSATQGRSRCRHTFTDSDQSDGLTQTPESSGQRRCLSSAPVLNATSCGLPIFADCAAFLWPSLAGGMPRIRRRPTGPREGLMIVLHVSFYRLTLHHDTAPVTSCRPCAVAMTRIAAANRRLGKRRKDNTLGG